MTNYLNSRQIKEIKKIDFVLGTFAIMFLACGAYNEYYYKEIVSKQFDRNLLIALMALIGALTVFLLMRSNICRNRNTALGTGIFPAIVCMLIAYEPEYKFQIISTALIIVLSTLRSWAGLMRNKNLTGPVRLALIVRYMILLTSTLGIVAVMFISV